MSKKNKFTVVFFILKVKKTTVKAFTLVELIVVITILAILGTIAFISLQGYSKDARDSVRISDISKIKTSLELFQLDAGKYPDTSDATNITYSGAIAWTQGTFGTTTYSNVEKLDKIPTDPVTDRKYVYSVTNTKQEYQLAGIMEGDEVSFSSPLPLGEGLGVRANATLKTAMLKISGNYNGKILKVSTGGIDYVLAVPSIITSSGFTLEQIVSSKYLAYNGYKNLPSQYAGLSYDVLGDSGIKLVNSSDLVVYSGSLKTLSDTTSIGIAARNNLIVKLQNAYAGTNLISIGEIAQIINIQTTNTGATELLGAIIVSNNLGGSITADGGGSNGSFDSGTGEEISKLPLITQMKCESAGWYWVNSENDVYIGAIKGDGFCISPRVGDFGDSSGQSLSWNGWGNNATTDYNGWNASSVADSGNTSSQYGQTRILDSLVSYNCKTIGTSLTDFEIEDTIEGRMKWLSTYRSNYTQLSSIEWVENITPPSGQPIPAIYLADCIDGVKDLGTNFEYKHYPNEAYNETITYSEYKTNETGDMTVANLSSEIYQNRQKYLVARTQKSGGHLPSAFSYITSGYASASDIDGDYLTLADRGEYQVACEANVFGDGVDYNYSEQMILAAIGLPNGTYRSRNVRTIASGCDNQHETTTGSHYGAFSVRFVVRP